MKHITFSCIALLSVIGMNLTPSPAEARGGVNASYARAYCYYYLTMVTTAARNNSTKALTTSDRTHKDDSRTAEYWRQAYRDCLKEHGY